MPCWPGASFSLENTMLVRICDIIASVRHVELPTKCPSCQEPVEAVSEINLTDSYIDGKIIPPDEKDVDPESIWDFESNLRANWDYGESCIVTGYRCGRCRHVLIEGAFHDEEGD